MNITIKSYKDLEEAFLSQEKFLTISDQEIKNYKLALNYWKIACLLNSNSTIGEELGKEFDKSLEVFKQKQLERGISLSTIGPQESRLKKLRDFYQANFSSQLPNNFYDRLRSLSNANNISLAYLYRQLKNNVSSYSFYRWGMSGSFPSVKYFPLIQEIETILNVREGTLLETLPARKIRLKALKKNTEFTLKLSENRKNSYGFLTPVLNEEIDKFITYKLAPIRTENLERNQIWTENTNGRSTSAETFKNVANRIFGYMCLPVNNENPFLCGLGIARNDLTLGLLAKSDLVISFVRDFLFVRAGRKYTGGHLLVIDAITPLLRRGTGYIYQKYEFSKKIGLNITREEWHDLCVKSREDLIDLRREIEKLRVSGSPSFVTERYSVEKISEILRNPNPLSITGDMLKRMLEDIPKLERSPREQAELFRDIVLVAIAQVVPLRTSMFAVTRLYKNLVRQSNGLWTITFERGDFKNRRFLTGEFRHTFSRNISLIIDKYIENYRAKLNGAGTSDLVFLPLSISKQPLSGNDISNIMALRSAQYIKDCKGFRMHCCRHIFVTDVIKKHGRNGIDIAAAALNDRPETIMKSYAHLLNSDYEGKINSHVDDNWRDLGLDYLLENGGLNQ